MHRARPSVLLMALGAVLTLPAACSAQPVSVRFGSEAPLWAQLLAAEDSRAPTPADVAQLTSGLRASHPALRRMAARALGRLERASVMSAVQPALSDPAPIVRAAAAEALGQAAVHGDAAEARRVLLARIPHERDPQVRSAIAETLGRLAQDGATTVTTTAALLTRLGSDTVAAETRLGAARGLYFLATRRTARGPLPGDAVQRLRALTRPTDVAGRTPADSAVALRIRTTAARALVAARAVDVATLDRLVTDRHWELRTIAASAIAADTSLAPGVLDRLLRDPAPAVRTGAVTAYARRLQGARGCAPLVDAARDADATVALVAIDAVSTGCDAELAATRLLDSLARTLPPSDSGWHRAAHALVGLAGVAPDNARALLPAYVSHANPFVRAWAARAAAVVPEAAALRTLAHDEDANVRTVAIDGLAKVAGHDADSLYVVAVETSDDSQLLQSAARALDGTPDPRALPALLGAFDRLAATHRETLRDGRLALLDRIQPLGHEAQAERLRPYLRDFDPQVAARVAGVLEAWTGTRPAVAPVAPTGLPLPTLAEVEALDRATVTVQMESGATIRLQLHPFDAPTNAARFARLARQGYFDGLTFHRVVPLFVVQGGSPHANEYAGDGPFTRDELGLSNWRGTVGISTRGRDTGDGQLYVNLTDNVRLDHDYTVFATVTGGMPAVDTMQEGARIRTVRIVP